MISRRSIHPPFLRWLSALVAIVVLAGCGGSGSSGFDSAVNSEPEAIRKANDEGSCVAFDGIDYCASGAPVVLDGDSAVVDFDQASDPLPCSSLPDDPACSTSVGFSPDGFPPDSIYLGAWAEKRKIKKDLVLKINCLFIILLWNLTEIFQFLFVNGL